MQMLYRCRPYEAVPGSTEELHEQFMQRGRELATKVNRRSFEKLCEDAVAAFDRLPLVNDRSKPRVGVVGEILVKFHPTANNELVKVIESEGCEANVPGLADFFLYSMSGPNFLKKELGSAVRDRVVNTAAIKLIENLREPINRLLAKSKRFEPYPPVTELAEKAAQVLSLCNTMGEGWLLTAEMVDLIETGTPNIVCAQPFACLPNHVVGKGVMRAIQRDYPEANLIAIDYDPGASEVNQLNRIKLMLTAAREAAKEAEQTKKQEVAAV